MERHAPRGVVLACGIAVWVAACGGDPPPPPPPPPPPVVNALGSATTVPWVQELWLEGAPGETVEALLLSSDDTTALPVVVLVGQDGARRALRLEGPGLAVETHVTTRPTAREAVSTAIEERGLRALVSRDGGVATLEITDTRQGGRSVLIRDYGDVRLRHPSFAASGNALFFDDAGVLGGVWRVDLPDGPLVRVVPEQQAASPVSWGTGEGERIAYVEDGSPPRIWVARAPESLPLRPAAEAQGEGRFPEALVALIPGEGGPYLPRPCDEPEPLELTATGPLTVQVGDAVATHARFCGRACTELYGTSPGGAPRRLARLERSGQTWRTWFGLATGIEGDLWAVPDKVDGLTPLPACFDPVDPAVWLVTHRLTGEKGEVFHEVKAVDTVLRVVGERPAVKRIITVNADGAVVDKRVLELPPPPGGVARDASGSVEVEVVDGELVWREPATGVARTLVEASDEVSFADPALEPDGDVLWVVDRGEAPGLVRLELGAGVGALVVPGAGLRRPAPIHRAAFDEVAWLGEHDGRATMSTARPLSDAEHEAIARGPISLTEVTADWIPVSREGGSLYRCTSPDRVVVGVDAEGGFLRWGKTRTPARAAHFDGTVLRVFDVVEGVPTVVAELILDRDVARWVPRALTVRRTATTWAPATTAEGLPESGPCRAR